MIGGNEGCRKFLMRNHYDAFRLAKFLAVEGAWYEFVPHDNDTYIVAVQPHMVDVVSSRLSQWHVWVERME